MSDQKSGVMVQGRLIPFPSSISPEARTSLEQLVNDEGVPLNALYTMPLPDDHAGWMKIKAAADGQYASAVKGLAGTLRASVETVRTGEATIHVATPETTVNPDCAYLDFHGGALVFGGGEACRAQTRMQADQHRVLCYGIDYRMPPEHPYPAALDDAMAAYRYVLELHAPTRIIIGGRSAGGNLAVAMLLRAKDEGLPLPAVGPAFPGGRSDRIRRQLSSQPNGRCNAAGLADAEQRTVCRRGELGAPLPITLVW